MKTKEIDVWVNVPTNRVNREDLYRFIDINVTENEASEWLEKHDIIIKGKLMFEIPEKKIEITESEFDKAINKYKSDCSYGFCSMKKELGF